MFKILNRPLSPHLTVYISQFTSVYSIWHRLTGVFLIVLIVASLLICKVSSYVVFYSCFINNYLDISLWLKNTIFLNFVLIFSYHLINGLRHVSWDLGFYLLINTINNSAKISGLILLTLVISILKTISS